MKIINLGFNKSGTVSLVNAMKILGFKGVHFKHGGKHGQYIETVIGQNIAENKPVLTGMEYDFYSDFNGFAYYDKIKEQYPGSKYIIAIRDVESWLDSRKRWEIKAGRATKETVNNLPIEQWRNYYCENLEKANRLKEQEPENYLIMNIIEGDGWDKLCEFLKLPIPEIPFPCNNVNTSIRTI